MDEITKDSIIADVLSKDREVARVFLSHGLFCLGCPSAQGESIEGACITHGIDVDVLLDDLNSFFEK